MRPVAMTAAAGLLFIAALSAPAQVFGNVPGHERAWELVTPEESVGADIGGILAISNDGSRVVYVTAGSMPDAPSGDLEPTNLAIRGDDGWSNSPLGFPHSSKVLNLSALFNPSRPLTYDADLEPLLWTSGEPLFPGAPVEGHIGIYRVQPDGTLALVVDLGEEGEDGGTFIGASEDASHVVFTSNGHRLPGDAGRLSGRSIYEIDGSGERLVDVDSHENPLSTCGSAVSPVGVSRPGTRIFFTNPAPSEPCAQPSQVFLREGSETVDVSASQCTRVDCNALASSTFAGATPDGSSVFIVSSQQLSNADHDELPDLYRYDVGDGSLSLISEENPGASGAAKDGFVQASVDGSRVYFAAEGRLLPGQGLEGGENLYYADPGGLHFVAPIGIGEEKFQISGDGRIALLETTAALEAGDTDGRSDVYLWSADSGEMTRLSKGNGAFDAHIVSPLTSQALLGITFYSETYRALSENGDRAFFSTAEQLLPADHNEVTDVYEWADGELGLVSSGTGNEPAEFAGVSPDGQTVLFKTAASLLPNDRDGGARDFYAARIGGGFPFESPPAPTECGAGACQPTPRQRLVRQAPLSSRTSAKAKQGRLSLLHVDGHAGASISSGGPLKVKLQVPAPGRVFGQASMQAGGHSRVVARGDAGAIHAGRIDLDLQVTPGARARLRRQRVLRVRLVLRQAQQHLDRELTLRLGGAQ
jgi:Tol biopolymer transport system component